MAVAREIAAERQARWEDDALQFPRLLAEIRAIGLTVEQYAQLADAMDLPAECIDDVMERAETAWQGIKARICG